MLKKILFIINAIICIPLFFIMMFLLMIPIINELLIYPSKLLTKYINWTTKLGE